ncbi:alkaline phosphatase PhoX [Zhongshania sp.]|uniref:alkaline phosphatase PhoX n=1 Tax=Zhongshania sp. TaxID=1971902 RepID=UPI002A82326A|nr:alkaline phosphatase PhoX [Zhongshania sp.]
MKRALLQLSIASILAAGLSACGGDDGDRGPAGADGAAGNPGSAGAPGSTGTPGANGNDGKDGLEGAALKRFASAPLGAEFTGLFVNSDGVLFSNIQHPSGSNTTMDVDGKTIDKGTIGAFMNVDANNLGNVAAMDFPITTADKERVLSAAGTYMVLAQQGDDLASGKQMGDIVAADGSTVLKNSNDPDFNAAVSDGGTGYFLYSNWEDRPGGMSRIKLSSTYAVTQEGMLDFSSVKGTWVNCFGTLSPWGTPLTSEELYFDNTGDWFNAGNSQAKSIAEYRGFPTDGSGNWGNPYDYGYIVEIGTGGTVAATDVANVTMNKLELMGRFSHENAVVMPDLRTVFLSDDGSGTVLFKFVADNPSDMSSGSLYAAKATQSAGVKDPAEAAFAIEWIKIATGNEATIEAAIASFNGTLAEAKQITAQQINDYAESKLNADLDTSGTVASNPFTDDRVGFLESRKAAAAMGATAEFNKMEGVNINFGLADNWWNAGSADGKQAYMYMAMSDTTSTMSDSSGAIQLDGTHGKCGAVYRMKLVKNSAGLVDIKTLSPAIVGGPYDGSRSTNRCNINNISNPDNLVVLDDGRVLIGEDTGNHQNNIIWLFEDPAL